MKLETDSIDNRGFMDARYTCDIDNSSPELRWDEPPEGTRGFALIVDDPDAPRNPPFCHWVVYNIPPDVRHLPAGVPPQESLPNGIRQGVNSAGKLGYFGPCPPPNHGAHRYIFKLYALRELPHLEKRPTRNELLAHIEPFIIATSEVMGLYQRQISRAG
ncbi:MAG: YbhB/YbcL family Raf kinase inhibitor-like protein [Oligoflexia bacterium]|nr:YbhB/YbcL family Raf kinase inhibitor-like protein [Oligoflexia bacterium]